MKKLASVLVAFASAAALASMSYAQTNSIAGDPVTIGGKVGIGTTTPTQKLNIVTPGVWDGLRIVGTQPLGPGAYFGMASTGGLNRIFDVYLDARPGTSTS